MRALFTSLLLLLAISLGSACSGSPAPTAMVPWQPQPLPTPNATPALGGTWHLAVDQRRVDLLMTPHEAGWTGTLTHEGQGASTESLDSISWDAASGRVEWRARGDLWSWYRGRIVEDVFVGRLAAGGAAGERPNAATAYDRHVIGWRAEAFDAGLFPRVYELLIAGESRARLRLDAIAGESESNRGVGKATGRFKIYATVSNGTWPEQMEYDAEVSTWDGNHLRFSVALEDGRASFDGVVGGRLVSGTMTRDVTGVASAFVGTRAEVLGHGYTGLSPSARSDWQTRGRKQLAHLSMGENPQPLSRKVTELSHPTPQVSHALPVLRDDDPSHWTQAYNLTELQIDYLIPDPESDVPSLRRSHAYLAVPQAAPPASGFPAVLSLNGHDGSAHAQLDPDNIDHWYGDAFARRGYVVLALDVSHRPLSDRGGLYADYVEADDAPGGNSLHPAIHSVGFDSDWTETGERTWDALQAADYLRSLPFVDGARVLANGMSMGGDIATNLAAFDERIAMAISANFSPDLSVLRYKNAHPCWQWVHADVREYLDQSDVQALVAPRPLVLETGRVDYTFSVYRFPWAGDKQVARRTRSAYRDHPERVVHYFHDEEHHYHTGDLDPGTSQKTGVRLVRYTEPQTPLAPAWQNDDGTTDTGKTLFEIVAGFLP